MHVNVKYYDFRLTIHGYTPSAIRYLGEFIKNLPPGAEVFDCLNPDIHLTLVSPEPFDGLDLMEGEDKINAMLHRSWADIEPSWNGGSLVALGGTNLGLFLGQFAYLIHRHHTPKDITLRLTTYLPRLRVQWLLQKGWILVHAVAVVRHGKGFMFLGQSGAGKSTVARQSVSSVDAILHDDRIAVRKTPDGYRVKAASASSASILKIEDEKDSSNPSMQIPFDLIREVQLSAFFTLKQDQKNYLRPLSKTEAARTLIQGWLEFFSYEPPFSNVEQRMHALSDLARTVPGYELHFRKSPDFWDVIDEQFTV